MMVRLLGKSETVTYPIDFNGYLAERQGFEPWDESPRQLISNQPHSAALAPLLAGNFTLKKDNRGINF